MESRWTEECMSLETKDSFQPITEQMSANEKIRKKITMICFCLVHVKQKAGCLQFPLPIVSNLKRVIDVLKY